MNVQENTGSRELTADEIGLVRGAMINHSDKPKPPEGPDPRRHFGPFSSPATDPTYPAGGNPGPIPV